MMRGRRPAGTPLSTLLFLNTLSAGAVSRPAMRWSTSFMRLSRSAANESTGAAAMRAGPPGLVIDMRGDAAGGGAESVRATTGDVVPAACVGAAVLLLP